jgi:hypothetical protein
LKDCQQGSIIHGVIGKLSLLIFIFMENNHIYKLDRYTTAFIDYKLASEKFYEAIFNIAQKGAATVEPIEKLAHVLDIKHAHFLECANRLLVGNNADLLLP